jgi:hypothetical protein
MPKAKKLMKQMKEKKVWVPDDLHYYKYGHQLRTKVNLEESDQEILQMLGDLFLSKIGS